jgi:hypothetical protein
MKEGSTGASIGILVPFVWYIFCREILSDLATFFLVKYGAEIGLGYIFGRLLEISIVLFGFFYGLHLIKRFPKFRKPIQLSKNDKILVYFLYTAFVLLWEIGMEMVFRSTA